jgi:subtilisin family serine protease
MPTNKILTLTLTLSLALSTLTAQASQNHSPLLIPAAVETLDTFNWGTWGLDSLDEKDFYASDGNYAYNNDGTGVTVYMIDTGVNQNSELTGRLTSYDFSSDVNTSNENIDCLGHGTAVSSIIAGTKYGVAKKANIVSLKVMACGSKGAATPNIVAALNWLIANHQPNSVLNISMAVKTSTTDFEEPINTLISQGVTVVVAAGNDNADACTYSPAYIPNAITVGSYDMINLGEVSTFSNQGPCIDIFAPGEEIQVANPKAPNGNDSESGTSLAAPFVSGAAATFLQTNTTATPADVLAWLTKNSKRFPKDPDININLQTGSPDRILMIPYIAPVVILKEKVTISHKGNTITLTLKNLSVKNTYKLNLKGKNFNIKLNLPHKASQSKVISQIKKGSYTVTLTRTTSTGDTLVYSKTITI